jgi:hypothetical protein
VAVDRAFDLLDGATDEAGEEIYEFEAGPPHGEWPILNRRLSRQERAMQAAHVAVTIVMRSKP